MNDINVLDHKAFPMNMLLDVLRESDFKKYWGEDYSKAPADLLSSVEYVLSQFDETDYICIKCKYEDGLTLKATGDIIGRSPERVRQRIVKTLHRLRHPYRYKMMIYGIDGYMTMEKNDIIDKYEKLIKDANESSEPVGSVRDILVKALDLSIRSYNALNRSGIDTVGEIVDAFRCEDIYKMRNLGRKSIEEIYLKMTKLGFTEADLSPDVDFRISHIAKKEVEKKVTDYGERVTEMYRDLYNLIKAHSERELEIIFGTLQKLQPSEKLESLVLTVSTKTLDNEGRTAYEIYSSRDENMLIITPDEKEAIIDELRRCVKLTVDFSHEKIVDMGPNAVPINLFKISAMSTDDIDFSPITRRFIEVYDLDTVHKLLMAINRDIGIPEKIKDEVIEKIGVLVQ